MTEPVAHQDAAALMQRLGGWLSGRMAGAPSVEIRDVVEPSQGFSSRTILFTAAIRAEGGWRERPLVARLQRDVSVPMLAAVFHQYRVMRAVAAHSTVKIPNIAFAEEKTGRAPGRESMDPNGKYSV